MRSNSFTYSYCAGNLVNLIDPIQVKGEFQE